MINAYGRYTYNYLLAFVRRTTIAISLGPGMPSQTYFTTVAT